LQLFRREVPPEDSIAIERRSIGKPSRERLTEIYLLSFRPLVSAVLALVIIFEIHDFLSEIDRSRALRSGSCGGFPRVMSFVYHLFLFELL
jgi:hypothetical protein